MIFQKLVHKWARDKSLSYFWIITCSPFLCKRMWNINRFWLIRVNGSFKNTMKNIIDSNAADSSQINTRNLFRSSGLIWIKNANKRQNILFRKNKKLIITSIIDPKSLDEHYRWQSNGFVLNRNSLAVPSPSY